MKIPVITQHLKEAVKTYLLAVAHEAVIRPIVTQYETEILAKHQFKVVPEFASAEGEVVTDPEQTYLISEEDFKTYWAECQQQIVAHKLQHLVANPNQCPLLVADYQTIQAGNAVIDAGTYLSGIKRDGVLVLELRQQAIDLIVGLVLSLCPEINKDSVMELIHA